MNKDLLKKLTPHLVALGVFILIAIIYCSPILEGKILQQPDVLNWKGMRQESIDYKNETGNSSFWSGSMFSGMPNYQIGGGEINSLKFIQPIHQIVNLFMHGPFQFILTYLICFYIFLRSFKVNKWVSLVGAIAIAFSSYFFIIIEAGHNAKVQSIALMAPIIAGFFLIFNKRYFWGILLTLIFAATGITLHLQMSYYFFMLIGCLFFAELFIHIKEKKIKDFLLSSLLFATAIGIGLGTLYTGTQLNREYVKETMRGGHSELVKDNDNTNKTSGLDLDYATQWSYGIDETMTLLIPNYMGGSSNYDVGTDSKVFQTLAQNGVPRKSAEDFCKNTPTYWGTQPFTSGPVYVGAIIFFLFILGLLIVKGPYKWALLVATIFSILLSLGKNFMPLTEFFFNYFPLYDKFRAVSSILVVAEVTIPLLGFLAIKAIMDKQLSKEKILQSIYISGGITAGICLVFALFGGLMYDFISPNDAQYAAQIPEWLMDAIVLERAAMLKADAWRSFFFIAVGAALVWLYVTEKLKFTYFVLGLGIFILVDMWGVNKRFFNNDSFVTEKNYDTYFKKQPYEEYILQDEDPHFRVFNLASNTFNESRTSYYFKSLGGYHGAKLRRYQDLIDEHLSKMNIGVINMLNAKYIIIPDNNKQPVPQLNPDAMGNAWFVDSLFVVNTPNEESDALNTINLRNNAVLDKQFASFAEGFIPGKDSAAAVKLLTYAPGELTYEYQTSIPGTIVFSEIYYPYGWKAFIDEKPVEHFRANYTLRALNVPEGSHTIRFSFDPDTYHKSEIVSYICIFILYGYIIGGIVFYFLKKRKEKALLPQKDR